MAWSAWNRAFDGYGRISTVRDAYVGLALQLQPRASKSADETHAALATSPQSFGDVSIHLRMRTIRQLRTGMQPNAWETAWVLWHYSDNAHFYYLALKPNGWELGKEDPAYPGNQHFLASGNNLTFPVQGPDDVRVEQRGNSIVAYANGVKLVSLRDGRPYASGRVGLYCEDSQVRFGLPEIESP